jgi:hypothetical protein
MTNNQAGQKVLEMLRETPAGQTAIRRAIYATLERYFGAHAEQILWRAAESLERAMGEAPSPPVLTSAIESEIHEENDLQWEATLERARSCRRS